MARNGGGSLSEVAIRRPVFTTMIMLGLVVLGYSGYRRLPIDLMPNIDFPVVAVTTVYPGASPATIEREVSRRLEETFNTVPGVDDIWSYSSEGVSQVIVFFELERDVDEAAADVRSKLEAVRRDLPTDIEAPVVNKFDPMAQPILSLSVSSETVPIDQLTTLADETVRRSIESVSGVGEVRLTGGLQRQIRVSLFPDRMQARGITVNEVIGALQRQNMEVPAGRLEQSGTEQLLRVAGRIREPSQFGNVIVATRNGAPIRLSEIARVELGTEEERSVALVNGERAVALDVLKVSGANTVDVAEGVKERLADAQAELPPGVEMRVVRDNSIRIRQAVEAVIHELMLGALLTVLVVMIFLNDWKATAITALALPVSVISAFLLMAALGFTLNMITLLALALSIGILIDDAIVVIENIVRHREMGQDHFTAARFGTREIILAVMATTFATVAVFVPVAFMSGIIGRFFFQFGLTVAWAVLISLFVSFTLTPMLSAWWGVDPVGEEALHSTNPLQRFIERFDVAFQRLTVRYRATLEWALAHRKTTLGIAVLAFFGALGLFPMIGGAFMPSSDDSEFQVTYSAPEGSSVEYARAKAEQVDAILRSIPGVDYTYGTVGSTADLFGGDNSFYVKLVPPDERDMSQADIVDLAREELSVVFGMEIAVREMGMGGGDAPIQAVVTGEDIDILRDRAAVLADSMRHIPGLLDISLSVDEPRPEYQVDVDRDRANELGLDIGVIAMTLRPLFAGQSVTRWEDPTGEEREVMVQVAPELRTSPADIANLPVATTIYNDQGTPVIVPLGQVATVTAGGAPALIERQNLKRMITVRADLAQGTSLAQASAEVRTTAAGIDMPQGYEVSMGGETEIFEETVTSVIEAILLSIILIYLILASQFESFTQPVAIMLSLPLSLVGLLVMLLLTGDTLNMMSMIGLILLMGLVTKNAILLVDNANEGRRSGMDRHAALVRAGSIRLRPIMMTTSAMILGMMPIALALSEGSGFRAPMARAVIGGLITSTLLTLLVVPVAYTYLDDIGAWIQHHLVSDERRAMIERERAMAEGEEDSPAPTGG